MQRATRVTVTVATAAIVAGAGVALAAAVSAQEPTTKADTTHHEIAHSGPDIATVARQLAEARRQVSALDRELARLVRAGGPDDEARLRGETDGSGQTAPDRAEDPTASGTDDAGEVGSVVRAPDGSVRQQPYERDDGQVRAGDGGTTDEHADTDDPREDEQSEAGDD